MPRLARCAAWSASVASGWHCPTSKVQDPAQLARFHRRRQVHQGFLDLVEPGDPGGGVAQRLHVRRAERPGPERRRHVPAAGAAPGRCPRSRYRPPGCPGRGRDQHAGAPGPQTARQVRRVGGAGQRDQVGVQPVAQPGGGRHRPDDLVRAQVQRVRQRRRSAPRSGPGPPDDRWAATGGSARAAGPAATPRQHRHRSHPRSTPTTSTVEQGYDRHDENVCGGGTVRVWLWVRLTPQGCLGFDLPALIRAAAARHQPGAGSVTS